MSQIEHFSCLLVLTTNVIITLLFLFTAYYYFSFSFVLLLNHTQWYSGVLLALFSESTPDGAWRTICGARDLT